MFLRHIHPISLGILKNDISKMKTNIISFKMRTFLFRLPPPPPPLRVVLNHNCFTIDRSYYSFVVNI